LEKCSVALLFGVVPEILSVDSHSANTAWYDFVWKYHWGHFLAAKRPLSHHKNIFCYRGGKGELVFNSIKGGVTSSVLEYSYPSVKDMKYQKNIDLFEYLVKMFSNNSDVVCDLFIGSGTTAIACERVARQCIGMELEPKYVALVLQRLCDVGLEPRLVDEGPDRL